MFTIGADFPCDTVYDSDNGEPITSWFTADIVQHLVTLELTSVPVDYCDELMNLELSGDAPVLKCILVHLSDDAYDNDDMKLGSNCPTRTYIMNS